MIKHQDEIIEEAIKQGDRHGSRLFYFSDKELYHGIEKDWYNEFITRAKQELESVGYTVDGILVKW